MKHVVVIAALDTKGDEARLIRDQVAGRGHRPVMVDVGVLADPAAPADVPARAVAEAGGASLDDLRRTGDKSAAMEAMTRGAAVVAARLRAEGQLDGVVAIGGSAGTAIGTSAMRALPVGVPKVMVSTVASGDTRPYVGTRDIAMLYSVVDVAGGVLSAGPHRLEASARHGVPAVVAPGCLDMVNFWAVETVPERYRERNLYKWNPNVTLMRTTPDENARLGRIIAEKLNASTGPVALLLPLRGLSQLDSEGNPYWWPEADRALFDALKSNLREDIPVHEVDANINDPLFADTAVEVLLGLMK